MRVAIFIDGGNYYKMNKKRLGWTIDLRKLLEFCSGFGTVVDAYYYTAIDPKVDELPDFLLMLPKMGFSLVTKPLKTIKNGDDYHRKGNMDIEIVIDMFNTIDNYDLCVLVSGDGDFLPALEMLRARGKRFKVLSCPGVCAWELQAVAGSHYINVANLESALKRPPMDVNSDEPAELTDQDMLVLGVPIETDYPLPSDPASTPSTTPHD